MVDSKGKPYTVHTSSAAKGRVDTEMTKILVEEVNARHFKESITGGWQPRAEAAARRAAASSADGKVAAASPVPKKVHVAFDVQGACPSVPTHHATTAASTTPATHSSTPIHDAEMAAKRRPITATKPPAPANTTKTAPTNTVDSPGPYTSTPGGKSGIKTTTSANGGASARRIPVKRLAPSPLATSSTPGARERSNKNVDADAPKVPETTVTWSTSDALPTAKVKVVEMPVRAPKGKGRKGTEGEGEGVCEGGWVEVDLEDDDWELV